MATVKARDLIGGAIVDGGVSGRRVTVTSKTNNRQHYSRVVTRVRGMNEHGEPVEMMTHPDYEFEIPGLREGITMATTFTLTVDKMAGAAFTNEETDEFEPHQELAAILLKVSEQVGEWYKTSGTVVDVFGNVVGKFEMTED